jgi:phosphoglycolate phosphatase
MSETAAIIFDLDGTLTDSAPGVLRSTRFALERLNVVDEIDRPIPSESELTWMMGPPLQESFEKLVGADRAPAMLEFYRERYAAVGMFENALYDGIVAALDRLRANGFRLFVATSKLESFARPILDHFALTGYFEQIYGAQSDSVRAAKSEVLSYLLERERIAASGRAVMIGDRMHDALGARAVGISSIGALWGYGDAEELTQAGADLLIDAPEEIPSAVASVFSRLR